MKLVSVFNGILLISFFACSGQAIAPSTKLNQGIELLGVFHTEKIEGNENLFQEQNGNELFLSTYENKTEQEARAIVENRMKIIDSMLHPSADPYFGARDPGPTCSEKLLPSRTEQSIFLFATQKHVYGACNSSLDSLKSQIQWVYCAKKKALFQIKYFYPASLPWAKEPIARCSL